MTPTPSSQHRQLWCLALGVIGASIIATSAITIALTRTEPVKTFTVTSVVHTKNPYARSVVRSRRLFYDGVCCLSIMYQNSRNVPEVTTESQLTHWGIMSGAGWGQTPYSQDVDSWLVMEEAVGFPFLAVKWCTWSDGTMVGAIPEAPPRTITVDEYIRTSYSNVGLPSLAYDVVWIGFISNVLCIGLFFASVAGSVRAIRTRRRRRRGRCGYCDYPVAKGVCPECGATWT
ncbi:MAG: hypothetical protein GIKADHBN_02479 [Phycisphaerales bacterium]|nr:hypothetical protein [Phycisphaerales bacterium]